MSEVTCWRASTPVTRAWHFSIRHRVFVEEQRVIPMTDVDDHDRQAGTIHVLACRDSVAVGTVRLYRTDQGGRWKGDRLAALPGHRAAFVGACLVRFAVSTAAAEGGHTMDALVQVQNVGFFERLGWSSRGEPEPYFGLAHQPMEFALDQAQHVGEGEAPDDAHLELPARRDSPSPLLVAMEPAATVP